MKIDRNNYEAFFLDHLEGRLSREQEKELTQFLSSNPDLASELDDYEPVHLEKEEIIFHDKSGIKKRADELTPVTQLIALMEGDLTPQEAGQLRKKIESDAYLKTQSELLLKTKLVPDFNIRFPHKNALKHKGRVIYMWHYAAAAAAIIIIGLTIVFRNVPDKKQNENVAQKSVPALPPVTAPVNDNNNKKVEVLADNKKPVLQSSPKKIKQEEKTPEQITEAPILAANETSAPAKEETLPTEQAAANESAQPVVASENTFSYNDVFTDDEWNELNSINEPKQPSRIQEFAKEGLSRLEELTGVRVQKQQDVFAFSIGKLEVRHVSGK